mmetsp:Transcript_19725/g.23480  ORF Transcript_19725/g.23480 Transcript_19725/m.23480 type:complete len:82 (-) Transcript_19725:661-906(-)
MQIGHVCGSPFSSSARSSLSSLLALSPVVTTLHCSSVPVGAALEVERAPCLTSNTKIAVLIEVMTQAIAKAKPIHAKRATA